MVHVWITGKIEEMNKKIEQNNETISRLQVENTELTKIKDELGSLR